MFSWIDVKFALRLLLKKPVFTATSVLIVALGLAMTVFSWSLLNSLIFSPLKLGDAEPVYALEGQFEAEHAFRTGATPWDFDLLRKETSLFAQIGVYLQGTALIGGANNQSATRKFNAAYTEWNVFEFSRVQPILGRGFHPDDHNEGAEPVIVLSYEVWQTLFNGDPKLVGQSIKSDAISHKVIGVMPQGFAFPDNAQAWLPLDQQYVRPTVRESIEVFGYARLQPGISADEANQHLDKMAVEIKAELPDSMWWLIPGTSSKYMHVVPYKQANADVTHYYPVFVSMLIVVLLILLLACINIGNLLLSRVNERFKEVAIRIALGAPSKRLVMQMLWESICICVFGGVIALLLAFSALDYANSALDSMFAVNQQKPFWWQLQVDSSAVLVLLISVIVMVAVTGFIPAWRALHGDFNAVLRDGTRGAQGKKASQATKLLVVSEILLSCVVLVMAFILLSTSYFAGHADYGVKVDKRLTAQLELPPELFPMNQDRALRAPDLKKRSDFYYQLKDHLEKQDNVETVIYMTQLPGRGEGTSHFEIEGRAAAVYEENPYSNNEGVSRDSWTALGMRVLQGRDYIADDATVEAENILVNDNIARDFFPDGNAVGSRVRRISMNGSTGDWRTIVGVVSNTYHGSTMKTTSAQYNTYHLIDRWAPTRVYLAMHYQGSFAEAQRTLQHSINAINPEVAAYHVQSYQSLIEEPNLLVSYLSKVFILCGVVAAILAASGIYAVAANSIIQKTQEIGVRRALGAQDGQIVGLFLKQAGWQLLFGLASGLGLAWLLINAISHSMLINELSLLLGTVLVPLIIALTVIVATLLPVTKALRREPADALHQE
ncbi:ABC transporter permease [Bowmanella sp. Y26]|uniref:ABC transporter permease n=1 Tax=Bowmanella yangjiangensis TaxID=2811230 RepID=UPI001BDC6705|nr:ABC transporter permease [Bowmanella yangjiangensis]MBT1062441.1 ABC transporter permease [Bowmanella yangjiangensis]